MELQTINELIKYYEDLFLQIKDKKDISTVEKMRPLSMIINIRSFYFQISK